MTRLFNSIGITTASLLVLASLSGLAHGTAVDSLSNKDAAAGLKKALAQGIDQAVGKLGKAGGFLDNPAVKIPLPPKLAQAEGAMRLLGMGSQADELVVAMNHAAEAAVPESKALLKQALGHMTVDDAKRILTGGNDAATQYFKRATYAPLQIEFGPLVERATRKVKLGDTYDTVAQKGVALGLVKPENATLQAYVTQKTLDGLFFMMAEEERAIRKDPLGQGSELLKRVFGALR